MAGSNGAGQRTSGEKELVAAQLPAEDARGWLEAFSLHDIIPWFKALRGDLHAAMAWRDEGFDAERAKAFSRVFTLEEALGQPEHVLDQVMDDYHECGDPRTLHEVRRPR